MSRPPWFLAVLLLLARCLAPAPAAAADAPPADGPRPLAKLAGPAGTAVAFSRDGKLILTAGDDEARVWDARTYEPVTKPLKHGDGRVILLAALSPDGTRLVTAAGDEAAIWDSKTGDRLAGLRHAGPVRSTSFSADGARVLTAGDDGTAAVWEMATGRRLLSRNHGAPVVFASFSPDGKTVVSQVLGAKEDRRDMDGVVEAWDGATGRLRWRADSALWPAVEEGRYFRRWTAPLAFAPDGRTVATIHLRQVELHDTDSGQTVAWADVLDTAGTALAVAFAGGGSTLVAATRTGVVLLDVPALLRPVNGRPAGLDQRGDTLCRDSWAGDMDVSADGARAAVALVGSLPSDPAVVVTDLKSGQALFRGYRSFKLPKLESDAAGELPCVALSPDGRRVAAGFGSDGYTAVWEVPGGKGR
jgi:WD40 repeat protein